MLGSGGLISFGIDTHGYWLDAMRLSLVAEDGPQTLQATSLPGNKIQETLN